MPEERFLIVARTRDDIASPIFLPRPLDCGLNDGYYCLFKYIEFCH